MITTRDAGSSSHYFSLRLVFEDYMEWLFSSVPSIRRLTASEMAGAVQHFCTLI